MIIEYFLEIIIPYITASLELIGVFIITIAAFKSLVKFAKNRFDFKDDELGDKDWSQDCWGVIKKVSFKKE